MKPSPSAILSAFEHILESIEQEHRPQSNGVLKTTLSEAQIQSVLNIQRVFDEEECKAEPGSSETLMLSEKFIEEFSSAAIRSTALQQLLTLLGRSHIRGLLLAVENISAGRFEPQLPSVPYEVDEDDGLALKIVRIVKSERDEPLGATIRVEEGGRVKIARVMAGGAAERCGCIDSGDRLLQINGVPVTGLTNERIVSLLNETENGVVTLHLAPSLTDLSSASAKESITHIRAMLDYNASQDLRHPCPEAALSFSKGDILQLVVTTDVFWWQAKLVGRGAFAQESTKRATKTGLIPSERMYSGTFLSGVSTGMSTVERANRATGKSANGLQEEAGYEHVCKMSPRAGLVRPIVLIGPPGVGRNELKRRLIMLFPERFSTTVPHTSRQPRPGEVNGIDYHFVSRKQMEDMIERKEMLEFGEYRGNLYGTSLSSVRACREQGVPLLCPHPLALPHLRTPEFAPFIVFIEPPDAATFKETRSSVRGVKTAPSFSNAQIQQIIDTGAQLRAAYAQLFDAIVVNRTLDESLSELIQLFHRFDTQPSWVPLCWATR